VGQGQGKEEGEIQEGGQLREEGRGRRGGTGDRRKRGEEKGERNLAATVISKSLHLCLKQQPSCYTWRMSNICAKIGVLLSRNHNKRPEQTSEPTRLTLIWYS